MSKVRGQNVKGQGHNQFSPNASNEKCTMGKSIIYDKILLQ